MATNTQNADGMLAFRNSQGLAAQGTLMSLSRQAVVFEVYNPYSIVQLSEVLRDVRVSQGDRVIYDGRAVVSNIVNTGLMLIVSATLVDPWSNLNALQPGDELRKEVAAFMGDWKAASQAIDPAYRVVVSKARNLFEELSLWLNHGEMAAGITDPGVPKERLRQFVADVEGQVMPVIGEIFAEFEVRAAQIDEDRLLTHKHFARREIHPVTMCSPFIHRTYTKPLGYAGDYEMVNMMFRDRWEGANTYAKIVNSIVIISGGAEAHRNRIDRLVSYLEAEGRRALAAGRRLRVLNIACGPAIEIQKFIRESPLADHCCLELLDFNAETLAYTRTQIDAAIQAGGHKPEVVYIHKSIHDLLQEARGRNEHDDSNDAYDIVYCAGLFDYLSDRICARLMDLFLRWTRPGGFLVATNVHPRNPVRYFIEHLLEWHLIYRDNDQFLSIAPKGGSAVVTEESTGVNVFLEVRKPTSGN
jgi:extracellular factor (EF) 3-hydroxypalmitic acid methyl ester biosynthesis protein